MLKRILFIVFLFYQFISNNLYAQLHQVKQDSLLLSVYHLLDGCRYDEAESTISNIYLQKKSLTPLQDYFLLCFEAEVMYYNALFGIGTRSTLEALGIAESLKNDTLIGNCYNFLGLFAMNEQNVPEAIGHLQKAIRLIPAGHDNDFISFQFQAYSNLAECFLKINQADSALYYSERSQKEASSLNRKRGLALNLLNIGDALQIKKDYVNAIRAYTAGLDYVKQTQHADVIQFLYTALMTASFYLGKISQAEEFLKLADGINKNEFINSYSQINFYQQAIAFQEAIKHYEDAFSLQKRLNALKHQNEKLEIEQRNNILERYYEKSKQVALLNLDSELKASELRAQSLTTRFLYVLLGIGSLFTVSLLLLYRQRMRLQNLEHRTALEVLKHQKELEQQKIKSEVVTEERNRIAKELHDELGSLAASIQIMSTMLEKDNSISDDSKQLILKMKKHSSQLSESLSDLVWAVYSKNDSFDNLIQRMKNYAFEILALKNIEVDFKYDYTLAQMNLGVIQRKNIFLLFKEAINNISKYSRATKVEIKLESQSRQFTMHIKDNGVGFDAKTAKTGNGLKNMQARAKAINGTLELKCRQGTGTEIILRSTL